MCDTGRANLCEIKFRMHTEGSLKPNLVIKSVFRTAKNIDFHLKQLFDMLESMNTIKKKPLTSDQAI